MDLMIHSSNFLLPTLPPADNGPALNYALIILNQRLPRLTPLLWQHAQLRVCADGGANRLFDELPRLFPHEEVLAVRNKYKPDVIKGDMDSVREDVVNFYSNLLSACFKFHIGPVWVAIQMQGTKIVDASHDQDTTDLHKCVVYIRDLPDLQNSNLCILVVGALGGRFDHEIGNINVVYHFSTMRIILLNDDCLIQLLPSTHHHEIQIEPSIVGPHCGLAPMGMPSRSTTTTGLQWDLTNTEMNFGGLVSTSNIAEGQLVTVHSDTDLIWTISIKKT